MRVGSKIQKLMSERGLGDREAARRIGDVSATTVGRWRKGEGEPSLGEAVRVAQAFGVPLAYLADEEADGAAPTAGVWDEVLAGFVAELGAERVCRLLMSLLRRVDPARAADGAGAKEGTKVLIKPAAREGETSAG